MSDISAKRAEEVAYNLQLSGVSGSTWRATEVDASNMLRALASERDALRAALQTARRDALEEAARVAEGMSKVFHPSQVITDRCAAAIRALGEKE